ncbi:CoA transferase [Marivita sp. GX14005]|uniref:CaiB/BaiF CoA transferase family protein n=1 Tax=Marivita sp. GX14005 TaxID=2942276 RepID=UPI002018AA8E|nr:CoA transferase [Marivita sp. GX14005]MCL3883736.1 CoA transferase [Marivita sp. GX14005]
MTRPLAGLTALDLSQGTAGGFATRQLADLGARVIKIERPNRGDPGRAHPPMKDGKSAAFAAENHSKSSIALDLKAEADRAIFDRLLARADILVETLRPGALERLGYDWHALQERHPRLILASLSGFGQTGPEARRPGYDLIAQARSGLMSITGAAQGMPVCAGAPIAELAAGLYLAQGILAALHDRNTTGTGRRVDVALLDAQMALLDHAIASAATTGAAPGPSGARHKAIAPCETFAASDAPFVIAIGNDRLFEKLCVALNLPLAGDPRFSSNPERLRNVRLLKRLIEAVTIEDTAARWLARLSAAGIPSAPIQTVAQAIRDPQITARHMIVDVLDRNGRTAFKAAGTPVKLSGCPDPTSRPAAPELDGNRGEILHWLER